MGLTNVAGLDDEAHHCSCEKPAVKCGAVRVLDLLGTPFFLACAGSRAGHRDATHAAPAAIQENLADAPEHRVVRAEMEALLLEEMRRLDDPDRFADQPGN